MFHWLTILKIKCQIFRKFPERTCNKRHAIFPDGYQAKKGDCVSPRALKHLKELIEIKKISRIKSYINVCSTT